MARALSLALLCACGRIGFDPTSGGNGAGSFCANLIVAPTFCDDFEDHTIDRWESGEMINGSASAASGVLSVSTTALGASDRAYVWAMHTVGLAVDVVASFTLSAPVATTTDPIVFELRFDRSGDKHSLEYVHNLAAPYLEEYVQNAIDPGTYYYHSLPPTDAGPHRVELDLVNGAGPTVSVTVDGATVMPAIPLVDGGSGTLEVVAGVTFLAGASAPWQIDLDDIVVDVR